MISSNINNNCDLDISPENNNISSMTTKFQGRIDIIDIIEIIDRFRRCHYNQL